MIKIFFNLLKILTMFVGNRKQKGLTLALALSIAKIEKPLCCMLRIYVAEYQQMEPNL